MGSDEHVLFNIDEGVGVVTLNRPERLNAVNWEMASRLVELFRELRFNDEVRVLVLTGAGRGFCAGGDAEWLPGTCHRIVPAWWCCASAVRSPQGKRLVLRSRVHEHGANHVNGGETLFLKHACQHAQ